MLRTTVGSSALDGLTAAPAQAAQAQRRGMVRRTRTSRAASKKSLRFDTLQYLIVLELAHLLRRGLTMFVANAPLLLLLLLRSRSTSRLRKVRKVLFRRFLHSLYRLTRFERKSRLARRRYRDDRLLAN